MVNSPWGAAPFRGQWPPSAHRGLPAQPEEVPHAGASRVASRARRAHHLPARIHRCALEKGRMPPWSPLAKKKSSTRSQPSTTVRRPLRSSRAASRSSRTGTAREPASAAVDVDLSEPGVRHHRRRHHRATVLRPVVLADGGGDRAGHRARLSSHGVLSSWGPSTACARWCSAAPASATAATSCPPASTPWWPGIGWFAVNSISGALALHVADRAVQQLCLLVIVAAQLVHRVLRPQPGAGVRAVRRSRCSPSSS